MSAVESLVAARELVARPGGWTQGASARDSLGVAVDHKRDEAVCFCVIGALGRVTDHWLKANNALRAIADGNVTVWNDRPGRTQDEVVALFDAAIAKLRMEGVTK